MHLIEVRNQVITVILKKDSFNLSTDIGKIKLNKELDLFKRELVIASFEALEQANYVKKLTNGNEILWISQKELNSSQQDINISIYTAEAIANTINTYRDFTGIKEGVSDKTKISEIDVQSLTLIVSDLLLKSTKESEHKAGNN